MDIVVKGRHMEVSERFRTMAQEKLAKVEKLDPGMQRVDVEVSKEPNPRLADRAYGGRGAHRRPHALRRRAHVARAGPRVDVARVPPPRVPGAVIEAVVFDLDGVLVDSEQVWDDVRRGLARERGLAWPDGRQVNC